MRFCSMAACLGQADLNTSGVIFLDEDNFHELYKYSVKELVFIS